MSGAWEGLISLPVAAWDPRYGLEGASAAEKDLKDAVRLPTGGELLRAPDVSDLVATLRSAAGGVGAGSPSAAHAAESAAAAKSPRPWLRDQAHVHLVVSPSGSAVGRGNTPLGTFHIKGSVQRPSGEELPRNIEGKSGCFVDISGRRASHDRSLKHKPRDRAPKMGFAFRFLHCL